MAERSAVRADRLSKRYWRGGRVRPDTFRDAVSSVFHRDKPRTSAEFWALADVGFEMQRGETLGIIGANGSGKSTLLKILARVIEPTSGSFEIVGRMASLLEVGTGFHHELTGRENMYFNGSLLGLSRKEIDRKADEIFEFAGVEDFADTPLKHYSSGMYVRLAFSVAAQLEPDVFIVDEALAVGDYQFQQRCVERMRSASRRGQTILFVTHSLGFVEMLCDRAMLLENGRMRSIGPSADVVTAYLDNATVDRPVSNWTRSERDEQPAWNPVKPISLRLIDANGTEWTKAVRRGADVFAEIEFEMLEATVDVSVGITLLSEHNVRLLRSTPEDDAEHFDGLAAGRHQWRVRLPTEWLADGTFTVSFDSDRYASAWYHNPYNTDAKVGFVVAGGNDGTLRHWHPDREGSLKLPLRWDSTLAPSTTTSRSSER